jgi:hypothetical protein
VKIKETPIQQSVPDQSDDLFKSFDEIDVGKVIEAKNHMDNWKECIV